MARAIRSTPSAVGMKNGILKRFFCVISESMKPGIIVITLMPCGAS